MISNRHPQSLMASDSKMPSQPDGTPTSATLEGLPIELRRKIYSHLLISNKVRQPPNEHLICYYRFETAILRVNKKIHLEASHMLYNENTFITVSCDWGMILTVMKNHEVAILCDKPKLVARFKKNIMRVHIKFSWSRTWKASQNEPTTKQSGNVLESFLILADELPNFTRMLHIMNMTNGGDRQKSKYLFRMESTSTGTPSLSLQKSLLEPFRHLYTWDGTLFSLLSEFDSEISKTARHLHSLRPIMRQKGTRICPYFFFRTAYSDITTNIMCT